MKSKNYVEKNQVINQNNMGTSPASLDGKLALLSPAGVDATLDGQRAFARAEKAVFQSQDAPQNLRAMLR